MSDQIARKRLKQKMLDRWENEGGRVSAGPTNADEARPTSDHEGEDRQPSASQENSTAGTPAAPTKKRRPPRK